MAAKAKQEVLQQEEEVWVEDSNPILDFLNRFGAAPAWAISLGMHFIILMLLGTVVYYPPSKLMNLALTTEIVDFDDEPVVMDNVQVDTVGSGSATQTSSVALSASSDKADSPQRQVEEKIEQQLSPVGVVLSDDVQVSPQDDLVAKVNKAGAASTENTGGTQGAIDRLTFELMSSLREHKTLVVWMFDASLSLQERRELIADRFENVYRQLEALDGSASKHLKTAVATFGEKTQILKGVAVGDVLAVPSVATQSVSGGPPPPAQ